MQTLVMPPAAQRDENAVQMLNAWIAERGLHCSIRIGMWEEMGHAEPRAWGILLADVVRHIANALQDERGMRSETTVAAIVEAIEAELADPTSTAKGDFHPGHT